MAVKSDGLDGSSGASVDVALRSGLNSILTSIRPANPVLSRMMRSAFDCNILTTLETDIAVPVKVELDGPVIIRIAPRGNGVSRSPGDAKLTKDWRGSGGA